MYPEQLRYSTEHEWVERVSPTLLRFGVTSFATEALGDVVYVALPAVGERIAAGQPCGEVESTKSVADLYAPLDGTVAAVNEELESAPELVNSDPYGQGWMVEAGVDSAEAADAVLAGLLSAQEYEAGLQSSA